MPIFAWDVPLISPIFLKRSLLFPVLLFSSISLHWSLRKSYLSFLFFGTLHSNGYIFPFLLYFTFLFFSQLYVRPPHTAILLFLHFFFFRMVLIPVSCTMSQTSLPAYKLLRRQARWSGITISLRIFHSLLLYTVKGFSWVNEVEVDAFLKSPWSLYD